MNEHANEQCLGGQPNRRAGTWQFSLGSLLATITAAAAWLAIAVQAGWTVAAAIGTATALTAMLVFGWYHALRRRTPDESRGEAPEWFYIVLAALVVAAMPAVVVVAVKGIEQFSHWMMLPIFEGVTHMRG